MRKNKLKIIFFCVGLALMAGGFFALAQRGKSWQKIENKSVENKVVNSEKEKVEIVAEKTAPAFLVAGWIPYWAKSAGVASLQGKLNLFSQLNLFAFSIDSRGELMDTMKLELAPWPQLLLDAQKEKVKIIPTILWGDSVAMHQIFADASLREKHADKIVTMLTQNDFAGVDLDYEGKDIADRDNFSLFLQTLQEKIQDKTINCTVEARTQDEPPVGFTGVRAMSWANDFSALNNFCDSVTLMAYDQVFQIQRAKVFEDRSLTLSAPNAENVWVAENIQYASRFIAPEKLILGSSTYGWEFRVEKLAEGYRYSRVRSLSYPAAIELANLVGAVPTRTTGGELAFTYQATDGQYLVTVDDAQAVSDKITLAKKFKLKGISLFKIDGLTDPKLFEVLEKR
jgi:spore germination protein YaaH